MSKQKPTTRSPTPRSEDDTVSFSAGLRRRHLRFGWWMLLIYLTFGLGLETLHGFKVRFYLDLANETRRHLWTLAHAHGTLLSMLNIAYALCLVHFGDWTQRRGTIVSRFLIAATVLMPAGFFCGGAYFDGGDPNPSIALVPIGGVCLSLAAALAAQGARAAR